MEDGGRTRRAKRSRDETQEENHWVLAQALALAVSGIGIGRGLGLGLQTNQRNGQWLVGSTEYGGLGRDAQCDGVWGTKKLGRI